MQFNIKKYAALARIKLTGDEEESLGKDVEKILDHFKEIQDLDTESAEAVIGGTAQKNIFREDKEGGSKPLDSGEAIKVPKIFQ